MPTEYTQEELRGMAEWSSLGLVDTARTPSTFSPTGAYRFLVSRSPKGFTQPVIWREPGCINYWD